MYLTETALQTTTETTEHRHDIPAMSKEDLVAPLHFLGTIVVLAIPPTPIQIVAALTTRLLAPEANVIRIVPPSAMNLGKLRT